MAWTIALSDADISAQTLAYTVPVGSEGRLSASFTNRSTSATATVTLWVVPNGEVVGNEHLKEPGTVLGLAGTSQATLERFFVAAAGTKVYVQASTVNVSCQIQGDVVQPVFGEVTDGTSSITYGTNWAVLGTSSLKRNKDGQTSLFLSAQAIGVPGAIIATIPAGYRPSIYQSCIPCVAVIGITQWPFYCQIDTSGQIQAAVLNSVSTIATLDSSSAIFIHSSYWT